MSTKNYLILTKKYKSLISSLHSIYRLINTTYDLTDLSSRLSKLLSQIFKSNSCTIALLVNSKKQTAIKCSIINNRRCVINKRTPIKNALEHRIVSTGSAIKKDCLLATPLINDDVIGFIIITRKKKAYKKDPALY